MILFYLYTRSITQTGFIPAITHNYTSGGLLIMALSVSADFNGHNGGKLLLAIQAVFFSYGSSLDVEGGLH